MKTLLAVLVAPLIAHADCPWVAPKEPPKFNVEEGSAVVSWRLDSKWHACAKKEGGELKASFLLGNGSEMKPFKVNGKLGASLQTGVWRNDFCEVKPPPTHVQVIVEGTGAMSRAKWDSGPVKGIHCDRCEYLSYEGSMAIHRDSRLADANSVTFEGSYGKTFQACALADSTMELRVYLGRTESEATLAKEPTFVVKGVEKSAKFRESIPFSELCKDKPKFVGVELFGTGEMAQLNGAGRSVRDVKCP